MSVCVCACARVCEKEGRRSLEHERGRERNWGEHGGEVGAHPVLVGETLALAPERQSVQAARVREADPRLRQVPCVLLLLLLLLVLGEVAVAACSAARRADGRTHG